MTAIEREDLLRGTREGAPHTSKRIQDAALDLFYERGYQATTMREIALACGLTPGALYNHFASKDELLGSMLVDIHNKLEATLSEAMAEAGDDPAAQLRAYARAHGFFHTQYVFEARVGNREIGSLSGPASDEVIAIRRRAAATLRGILERGSEVGAFWVPEPAAVSNLIHTMGMAIANWFKPEGDLSQEQMADLHADLVMRMVSQVPNRR